MKHYAKAVSLGIVAGFFLSFCVAIAHGQELPPGQVNINSATLEQLQFLPGVGPAVADSILYAREQGFTFGSCEDLQRVKGIGERKAQALCSFVTTEDGPRFVGFVVFEGDTTATGPLGSKAKTETGGKFSRPKSDA